VAEHVDLIREAVRLMRQRAEAATEGPWTAHPDGLVWAERLGDPVSGSTEIEDAEHIASWHPSVALLVADALERVAWALSFDKDLIGRVGYEELLAVARAYLGELDGSTHDGYPEVDRA
jgi:hypothetical protein